MLLAAPEPTSLEVIGDTNGFIANFGELSRTNLARLRDGPTTPCLTSILVGGTNGLWRSVSDLAPNPRSNWPGDAKVAGWWLWGQVSWIGSGWCDWEKSVPKTAGGDVSDAGQGIQAIGQIPHVSSAGQGIQAIGQIHTSATRAVVCKHSAKSHTSATRANS